MASVYVNEMRRFFVDKADKSETKLSGAEYKHLAEVLRARVGDKIILCPNDGRDYVYAIKALDKTSATLEYLYDYPNETECALDLTVYPALLKGDKTELVVQKLTELGVKNIRPFISEFTVQKSEKSDRLQRAAHEAAKQCGRAIIPSIDKPQTFDKVLPQLGDFDNVVFAYEGTYADGKRIDEVIRGDEKSVALIVGPEGGFSEKEVLALTDSGYMPVTLGKRILRAETASIAGSAVIMFLTGEWK